VTEGALSPASPEDSSRNTAQQGGWEFLPRKHAADVQDEMEGEVTSAMNQAVPHAEERRIGVFICHCGGNISDVVDVKRVAAEIAALPGVVFSDTHMFMCSDPGQAFIEEKIKDLNLNRVIVAACSPSLHEVTFRRTLHRAGLNPYLFEHVNVREQVSWVIQDREAATQKATRLVSAAVGRVVHLVPLEKRRIAIHPSALVIGGGVAGLIAARDLSRRGIDVTLVEQAPVLGGRMLELDRVYPTNERARDLIQPLVKEVESDPRITVLKNATLESSTGFIGSFIATVRVTQPGGDTKVLEVKSGVILLAVGLDVYEPRDDEYGYHQYPEVVTLMDLHRMLDPQGPTGGKVQVNGKPIKNVAFIHCVGSRQHTGVHKPQPDGKINEYCSRYCCTAVLHAAVELKERMPGVNVFEFYEDIRAYGRGHEEYYTEAGKRGVVFFRFDPLRPPVVQRDPLGESPLVVCSVDRLTLGEEVEVPVDMVVLATGFQARDMTKLIDIYRCSRGVDRFLLEAHPKLRPVELAVFGVFLAGSAQGPMDVTEGSASAAAAASKAAGMVARGFIELDPFIAQVNEPLCTGCQTCLNVCPYDAIRRNEEKKIAQINPALCTGCGTCVAVCPSAAIFQYGFSDDMILSELKALLSKGACKEHEAAYV
jgi:heterodisulfide reductase subunit A